MNLEALESMLSEPPQRLIDLMSRLEGDIMILGISGKIGVSLGLQAMEAVRRSGKPRRVYGVSRFTNKADREKLSSHGVVTIACDLLERDQIASLPKVKNIIFMAGRKFSTQGNEPQTWAFNTVMPAYVAETFRESRIVVFSTGCVYPLRTKEEGGCREDVVPLPVGEYSQSCLGRERVFEYFSEKNGTPVLLFRLNYSVDLRYGVLDDIGRAIWEGRCVNNNVGYFNVIWQGDVTANALMSLELAASPSAVLNVTGPETMSVEEAARRMGAIMGRPVQFLQEKAGDLSYLNDATRMCELFGPPRFSLDELMRMQAEWIMNGGISIGKPTHYEVSNGRF